jgi:hypothetical protein
MRKIIGFFLMIVLFSCEKDNDNSLEFMSFDYDGSSTEISENKYISTGRFFDMQFFRNDSVILNYYSSFNIAHRGITVSIYYFIKEDSSKVVYNNDSYPYKNKTDFDEGILSTSNKFHQYPFTSFDSSISEFEIVRRGAFNYTSSGIFIVLNDYRNDLIYYSNKLNNEEDNQIFIIDKSWTEAGPNGEDDRVYFNGEFNIDLYCTTIDKTIRLNNGKFQMFFQVK